MGHRLECYIFLLSFMSLQEIDLPFQLFNSQTAKHLYMVLSETCKIGESKIHVLVYYTEGKNTVNGDLGAQG